MCARYDPNPIIDTGAPHSIGGISAAAQLANALGLQLLLEPPSDHVKEISWGPTATFIQPIVATWNLQVPDIYGVPTGFLFHVKKAVTPLLLVHDVLQHSTLHMNDSQPFLEIQQHSSTNRFFTYTQGVRTRIEFAPIYLTCIKSSEAGTPLFAEVSQSITDTDLCLLSERHPVISEANKFFPDVLASRLHSYSHASVRDLKRLLMRVTIS